MAAQAVQMEELINRLPPEFVQCRDFGHAWGWNSEWGPMVVPQEGFPNVISRKLRCLRCSTERTDFIDRTTGFVSTRHYRHPDGYLHKGTKFDKASVRVASIRAAAAGMKPTRRTRGRTSAR